MLSLDGKIPTDVIAPFLVSTSRVTTVTTAPSFSAQFPPLTGNFWKSHQSIPVACAWQKVGWLDSCGNSWVNDQFWHGWMVKMLTGNHQQLNRSTKKGLGVTLESPSTSTRSWLKSSEICAYNKYAHITHTHCTRLHPWINIGHTCINTNKKQRFLSSTRQDPCRGLKAITNTTTPRIKAIPSASAILSTSTEGGDYCWRQHPWSTGRCYDIPWKFYSWYIIDIIVYSMLMVYGIRV